MRVARCLYERAVGWEQKVERTVLHQGKEWVLKNVVNHPPNVQACIFWLRNRQRASWGDRVPAPAEHFDDIVAGLEAGGQWARQQPASSANDAG